MEVPTRLSHLTNSVYAQAASKDPVNYIPWFLQKPNPTLPSAPTRFVDFFIFDTTPCSFSCTSSLSPSGSPLHCHQVPVQFSMHKYSKKPCMGEKFTLMNTTKDERLSIRRQLLCCVVHFTNILNQNGSENQLTILMSLISISAGHSLQAVLDVMLK